MILNVIATICLVVGWDIAEQSELWGIILAVITSMCYYFSFLFYESLKERIKTLEEERRRF